MNQNNSIEIELINGNRVLLEQKWNKVYNLCEKTRWLLKRTPVFPFFKFEKQRYVKFKFMTAYETITSCTDPTYRVKCTLLQFASMFGIKISPFEKTLVENDLAYDA